MRWIPVTVVLAALFVAVILGRPSENLEYDDSKPSETGHPHAHPPPHKAKGRLQIKVYRGPHDGHHHAPWGYWLKHPEDDKHKGKY